MIQVRSAHLAVHNPAATPKGLPRRSVGTHSAATRSVQLVCTISAAPGHDKPEHPETAARVVAVQDSLAQSGLLEHPQISLVQPPKLEAADISQLQEVLQLVHPAGYLARLQEICASLQGPTMIDDSTYIAPGSYLACCEVRKAQLLQLHLHALLLLQQQHSLAAAHSACVM